MIEPLALCKNKWGMVYCYDDFDLTTWLYNSIKKASKRPGIIIEEPKWVELKANSNEKEYIEGIDS